MLCASSRELFNNFIHSSGGKIVLLFAKSQGPLLVYESGKKK